VSAAASTLVTACWTQGEGGRATLRRRIGNRSVLAARTAAYPARYSHQEFIIVAAASHRLSSLSQPCVYKATKPVAWHGNAFIILKLASEKLKLGL
jgi:hypothetical protein